MELQIYGEVNNPSFLARDIAERIDYRQDSLNKMLDLVDDGDEKLTGKIFRSGQKREMWFLTEHGVYSILMKSSVPKAKEFRKGLKEFLKAWRNGEVKVVTAIQNNG